MVHMKTICIVPCGKKKIWDQEPEAGPSPARKVYVGAFSKKCQLVAEMFYPGCWYIISAKHGFLAPNDIVPSSYNVTFNDLRTKPISIDELTDQANKMGLSGADKVVALGGRKYIEMVKRVFTAAEIDAPLAGCSGIGVMMHHLNQIMDIKKRENFDSTHVEK